MKLTRWLAAVIALALLGTGCARDPGADRLDRVALQLGYFPTSSIGPYVYGIDQGIFAEHGIELELLSGQGTGFAMIQVDEGTVKFAEGTLTGYLAHRAANDAEITAVAVISAQTLEGIMTTFPAASLDDLVGHSVAIAPFGSFQHVFPILLDLNGVPRDAVTIESVVTSAALLLEGVVDAIEAYKSLDVEIITAEADAVGVPVYYLEMADFGLVGYHRIIVVSDDVIATDQDLVRRFVAAMVESTAASIAADDAEVARLIVASVPGYEFDLTLLQWQRFKETLSATGRIDPEVVRTNLGYVRDGLGIDHDLGPEDVFTNEFVP